MYSINADPFHLSISFLPPFVFPTSKMHLHFTYFLSKLIVWIEPCNNLRLRLNSYERKKIIQFNPNI